MERAPRPWRSTPNPRQLHNSLQPDLSHIAGHRTGIVRNAQLERSGNFSHCALFRLVEGLLDTSVVDLHKKKLAYQAAITIMGGLEPRTARRELPFLQQGRYVPKQRNN